jgi:hypothetical protein
VKQLKRENLRAFLVTLALFWLVPFSITLPFVLSDPVFAVVFATICAALLLLGALTLGAWDSIRKKRRGKKRG